MGETVETLRAGTMVGEFRLQEVLGHGGMGTVYRAVHPRIHTQVAIKVLNRERVSDLTSVARFEQEAWISGQLRHPNIVSVFSMGQLDDGRLYYVMEYLEGATLAHKLKRDGAMSLGEALPIIEAVAAALDSAHQRGAIHRDVKPANIFLLAHGTSPVAKLLDFGIAKMNAMAAPVPVETRTGDAPGSPHYMSPEQCRGQSLDHRSDIYSLGVVVYEMLAGQRPFEAETYGDLLYRQQMEKPTPLTRIAVELPAKVDSAVMRALKKEPAARYEHATQLHEALRKAAPTARSATAPAVDRAAAHDDAPTTVVRAAEPRGRLRTLTLAASGDRRPARLVALVAAAALVVAAAVIALVLLRADEPATSTAAATPDAPRADRPRANEPKVAAGTRTADKPTTDKPTADTPTADTPTADTPTADTPTADKSTADKPTADTPTADKPTADKPTAVRVVARGDDPPKRRVQRRRRRRRATRRAARQRATRRASGLAKTKNKPVSDKPAKPKPERVVRDRPIRF